MASPQLDFAAVGRIWEKLRNQTKIDWSKIKNRRDYDRAVAKRRRELEAVAGGQKTLEGTGKRKAKAELRLINKTDGAVKKNWSTFKRVRSSEVTQHSRGGKVYSRNLDKWTPEQERFLRDRKGMPSKDLTNSFNNRFGETTIRSRGSIRAKARRL